MASSKPTSAKKPNGRRPKTPSPSKATRVSKTPKGKMSEKAAAAVLRAASAEFEDSSSEDSIETPQKSTPSKRRKGKNRSSDAGKEISSPKTPQKSKASRKKQKKVWPFTHVPARMDERSKNGRHEGRNLIVWTRPRMAEKFLLHLQYEIARHKIDVPWDSIAHRMHPGSSGSALLQFLNRLRAVLIAEGHLIPPPLPKPGSRQVVDPTIRGYVRDDMDGPDAVTTRPVPFSEPMEDRRYNLPDAFEANQTRAFLGSARKRVTVKQDSPDPADLDGDADYTPEVQSSGRRHLSRAATVYADIKCEDDDGFMSSYDIHHGKGDDEEDEDEEVEEDDEESELSDVHTSGDDDDDDADADANGNAGGSEEAADDDSDAYASSDDNGGDSGDSADSQGYAFTGNSLMSDPFLSTPVHMSASSGSVAEAMLHHSMASPVSYMSADALPSSALYYGMATEAAGYIPPFDHGMVSSPAVVDHSFAAQGGMTGFEGAYANDGMDGEYDQLFTRPADSSRSVFTM